MIFSKAPDDRINGYFYMMKSENGKVFIGVKRVMFGWRVVAFTKTDIGPVLNWCAGDIHANIERLYSLMLTILSKREESEIGHEVFAGIPRVSNIKPFFHDLEFVTFVSRLAGDDLKLVTLPEIAGYADDPFADWTVDGIEEKPSKELW